MADGQIGLIPTGHGGSFGYPETKDLTADQTTHQPKAPNQPPHDNSSDLANTAYVDAGDTQTLNDAIAYAVANFISKNLASGKILVGSALGIATAVDMSGDATIDNLGHVTVSSAGAGVPPGTVLDYAGGTIPTGFLACDGASYLRSAQPTLFAAIGTIWGAVDGTHFNVPDTRDRESCGAGGLFSNGSIGGSITHSHNMKNHTHAFGHTHDLQNHTHAMAHTHPFSHFHTLFGHTHDLSNHNHGMASAYALIVLATGQVAYNQISAGASWFSNNQITAAITTTSVSRGNACKINGTTDPPNLNITSAPNIDSTDVPVPAVTDTSSIASTGVPAPNITGSASTSTTGVPSDNVSDVKGGPIDPYIVFNKIIKT